MKEREKSITTGKDDIAAAASSPARGVYSDAPIPYTETANTRRKKVMISKPLNSDSPNTA